MDWFIYLFLLFPARVDGSVGRLLTIHRLAIACCNGRKIPSERESCPHPCRLWFAILELFYMRWCKSKLRKCRLIRLRYQMLTSYYTFANWPIGKLQVIPVKICPSHFCKDPPIFHFWESSVSMASRETVTVSSTGPIVQRYTYTSIERSRVFCIFVCTL